MLFTLTSFHTLSAQILQQILQLKNEFLIKNSFCAVIFLRNKIFFVTLPKF